MEMTTDQILDRLNELKQADPFMYEIASEALTLSAEVKSEGLREILRIVGMAAVEDIGNDEIMRPVPLPTAEIRFTVMDGSNWIDYAVNHMSNSLYSVWETKSFRSKIAMLETGRIVYMTHGHIPPMRICSNVKVFQDTLKNYGKREG